MIKQNKKQTEYYGLENNEVSGITEEFYLCAINEDTRTLIDGSFKGDVIEYVKKKDLLILSKKPTEYTISGTIKDAANGETIFGASVYSKGTTIGVTTNEYGFYSITVPEGNYDIVVSYMGYSDITKSIILREDQKEILK